MFAEFKAFLLKTNALALAIGVIIGAALGGVVNSLVNDIIMPPIGYALGGVNFNDLQIVLKEATLTTPVVAIKYGAFIQFCITFVIVAFVVFMIARTLIKTPKEEAGPAMKTCPFCKELVLGDATKCRYCASPLTA